MPPDLVPAQLPPPVLPGDRVGVAALSGPVDPARLDRGLAALAALGFEPVSASNLRSRHGFHAGDDDERLDAFHALAADDSIAAVLFARGGHGLLRLLPRLDWDLLARRPRAYVGYSDLTPLLLEVPRRLGFAAFHGPMVAADLARGLTGAERASFLDALAGRLSAHLPLAGVEGLPPVAGPVAGSADRPVAGTEPGRVRGVLVGGCLSLLTATLGTPWAPRLGGALLFWEDVDEPAYRIDRMLTHLDLSSTLVGVRGMISGHVSCSGRSEEGEGSSPLELLARRFRRLGRRTREPVPGRVEVARRLARERGLPFGWGLEAGHRPLNRTLPLGIEAVLDAEGLHVGEPGAPSGAGFSTGGENALPEGRER